MMCSEVAIDTDVLMKAAIYHLTEELYVILNSKGQPAVLGLTHLIAERQLVRKRGVRNCESSRAELIKILEMFKSLEPSNEEIALAADLTAAAQEHELPLDVGEAQLAAIVMLRKLPLLATGDKRALHALSELTADRPIRELIEGRIVCFEQLIEAIAQSIGIEEIRKRICAEPSIDGAMRLVFACGREPWDTAQFHNACTSFIEAVREQVGNLLIDELSLT